MNPSILRRSLFLVFGIVAITSTRLFADGDTATSYQVVRTFTLGGEGRWDYATLDAQGQFLYLTRTTHTFVVDTAYERIAFDIPGGEGLHGVALAPDVGRGFISDGKGGAVIIFDLKTRTMPTALSTTPQASTSSSLAAIPPNSSPSRPTSIPPPEKPTRQSTSAANRNFSSPTAKGKSSSVWPIRHKSRSSTPKRWQC